MDEKIHFILNEKKSRMLGEKKYFFKNASQNILTIFFVSEVFNKNVIFNVLLMIIEV
jgi:hypothetical protein